MLSKLYSYFFNRANELRSSLVKKEGESPWKTKTFSAIRLFIFEILSDFFRLFILLFKSPYESFQLFTKQETLPVCEYSYFDHKRFQKKVRLFSLAGMSSIISATIIINLILSLILPGQLPSYAKTVSGGWDDWSLTTLAGDPPVGSAGSIAISPASSSLISGSGTDSYIKLANTFYSVNDDGALTNPTITQATAPWSTLAATPGGVFYGGSLSYDGSGNIYAFQGNYSTAFWKYSISANTWSTLAATPGGVSNGGSLSYDGSGNIYAFQGWNTTTFWKYSISGNTWSTLAITPDVISFGGSLSYDGSGNIYALRGSNSVSFWKYSISGNTWSTMTSAPASVFYGGSLFYGGSGNFYAFRGNSTASFWKYSISANTWSTLAATPGGVSDGGSLSYDGSGNIYAFQGWNTTAFWKYSISGNTWSTLAITPGGVSGGGSLSYGGSGNFYAFRGSSTASFWKYSIFDNYSTGAATGGTFGAGTNTNTVVSGSGSAASVSLAKTETANTWTTMAPPPTGIKIGDLSSDSKGNFYALPGDATTNFWKYTVSSNTWSTMAPIPGGSQGGGLSYDSQGNFYLLRGHNGSVFTNDFYKYTVSSNTWSTMAPTPVSLVYTAISYDSQGNFYVLRGYNGSDFYKYSVSSNTWSTMAPIPESLGGGSSLSNDSQGNFYALTTTNFWKYTVSSNTWSTMAPPIASHSSGGDALSYDSQGNFYALQGNSSTAFWKYSISGNTWSTMAVTPVNVGIGGSLAYDGSGNFYAFSAWNGDAATTGFYKYSIYNNYASSGNYESATIDLGANAMPQSLSFNSTLPSGSGLQFQLATSTSASGPWSYIGSDGTSATYFTSSNIALPAALSGKRYLRYKAYLTGGGSGWTTMASAPATNRGKFAYDSQGNFYALHNDNSNAFWKYTISSNTWSIMAATPAVISGTDLSYDSQGNFYALRGASYLNFWKYSISGNTWSDMAPTPNPDAGNSNNGNSLSYDNQGNFYALRGFTSTYFYKYSISANTWSIMAAAPANVYRGNLSYDSQGNFYALRGGVDGVLTDFWKYSISSNTWSTMAATPWSINYSGGLSYDGSGNFYALQGNNATAFWKYSISSNTWSTMAATPELINDTDLSYDSQGNFYALRGISTATFLKYSTKYTSTPALNDITINYSAYSSTSSVSNLKFNGGSSNVTWAQVSWVRQDANTASSTIKTKAQVRVAATEAALASAAFAGWDGVAASAASGLYFDKFGSGQTNCSEANGKFGDTSGSNAAKKTVTCALSATDTVINPAVGSGSNQWLELQLTLQSDGVSTPQVDAAKMIYSVNTNPEVCEVYDTGTSSCTTQATASQSQSPANYGYITLASAIRDQDTNTGSISPGQVLVALEYASSGSFAQGTPPANSSDAYYQDMGKFAATFSLTGPACIATGRTDAWKYLCDVATSDPLQWTPTSASWNIKQDAPNVYSAGFKVRLLANDQEGINQNGFGASGGFTVDTANPTGAMVINAKDGNVAITATDDTTISYKLSNNGATWMPDTSWGTISPTIGWSFIENADRTVTTYFKLRDAYGNESASSSVITGQRPTAFLMQDISNVQAVPPVYKNFLSWEMVAVPINGFGSYKIYRCSPPAEDPTCGQASNYSLVSTIADRTMNYYLDSSVVADTAYYYRGLTIDSLGNLSGWVPLTGSYSAVWGTANGTQDGGEGGGGGDVAPPVISSLSVSDITQNTATINWTTSEVSNSGTFYSADTSYSEETSQLSYVTSHSVTLEGLSQNTAYNLQLKSTDASGNQTICDGVSSASTVTSIQGQKTATNETTYCQPAAALSFTTSSIDVTAPVISGISISDISYNSAKINWTTNESSDSCVGFDSGSASRTYRGEQCNTESVAAHSLTIGNLSPTTTYYIKVKSRDAVGNLAQNCSVENNADCSAVAATDANFSFTTTDIPPQTAGGGGGGKTDFIPPVVTNTKSSDVGAQSATITFDTDENATSFVEYGTDENSLSKTVGRFDAVTSHKVSLKDLSGGTEYFYRAASSDWAGNIGYSRVQTFTTKKTISTEELAGSEESKLATQEVLESLKRQIELQGGNIVDPLQTLLDSVSSLIPEPIIIGETPDMKVETTTASISWRTDKNSSSFIALSREDQYDATSEEPYKSVIGNPEDMVKEHTVELTNLLPATKYNFQVRSKALLGETSKSKNFSFITKSQLPQILNYLQKKTDNEKTATVYWETNIPTDSVVKYTPYVKGKLEPKQAKIQGKSDMVADHEVTLIGLDPATIYQMEISGKDPFGNLVYKILPDFTTAIDKDAPVISQVRVESAMITGKVPKIQTIVAWRTDEPATGQVFFAKGAEEKMKSTQLDIGLSTIHTAVITEFNPAAIYRIKVESKDESGNLATSRDFTILTPQKTESIIDIIIRTFENTFGWVKNVQF